MLVPMVERASSSAKVKRLLGDGGYGSRANFRYLHDSGMDEPVIKVRKSSSMKAKGCMPRISSSRWSS